MLEAVALVEIKQENSDHYWVYYHNTSSANAAWKYKRTGKKNNVKKIWICNNRALPLDGGSVAFRQYILSQLPLHMTGYKPFITNHSTKNVQY